MVERPNVVNRPRVAIVGAGIAGLTAAHELVQRDFQVSVYEHRFHAGGKAASSRVRVDKVVDLPGEHGFHFFPGWYRHLPDTLGRIPSDRQAGHVARPFVLDHLVEVPTNILASYTRDPVPIVLHAPRNADQAQKLLSFAFHLQKMGLSLTDAVFFMGKLVEFLSVPDDERRQKYDSIPWTQFIGLDERTEAFRVLTAHTRSLIAANPHQASAYTIATLAVRTLIESTLVVDRVLDGPTSEVWIDPWVRYLEGAGVTFHYGYDLDQIDLLGGEPRIDGLRCSAVDDRYIRECKRGGTVSDYRDWRRARGKEDDPEWPESFADFQKHWEAKKWRVPLPAPKEVSADYYVFALPIEQMAYYINRSTMMTYYDASLRNIVRLSASVEWMAGVQFYFRTPFNVEQGHIVFADSEWALTAVDQTRYWRGQRLPPGVQSILSVDISAWNRKGRFNNKEAYRCTKDEIAEEVFQQIAASFNRRAQQPVLQESMLLAGTVARSYHLDDNIVERLDDAKGAEYMRAQSVLFSADELLAGDIETEEPPFVAGERTKFNVEPLLVNRPGSLLLRPAAGSHRISNMFLAADYVNTATNLACMEGANEAGRLAVNALLDQAGSNHDRCRIWKFSDQDILSTLASVTTLLRQGPGIQNVASAATSAVATVGSLATRAATGFVQLWNKR